MFPNSSIRLRKQWPHLLCLVCSLWGASHIWKLLHSVASPIFLVIFSATVYQEETILFSLTLFWCFIGICSKRYSSFVHKFNSNLWMESVSHTHTGHVCYHFVFFHLSGVSLSLGRIVKASGSMNKAVAWTWYSGLDLQTHGKRDGGYSSVGLADANMKLQTLSEAESQLLRGQSYSLHEQWTSNSQVFTLLIHT